MALAALQKGRRIRRNASGRKPGTTTIEGKEKPKNYRREELLTRMLEKKKGLKPIHAVFISVTILALAAAAVIVVIASKPEPAPVVQATAEPAGGGRGTVLTEENLEEFQNQSQQVDAGYYNVRMNVDWEFPTGSEPAKNALVENPTTNMNTVYFEIILNGTEELVYSSPFIPVGAKLENFTLDKDLAAGEYAGKCVYHLVDEQERELSTVSIAVKLRVAG